MTYQSRSVREAGKGHYIVDGDLAMTTDFRRVYATMIKEWLGYDDTALVLKAPFEPLGVFASS